jgi:hypothetical protein
MSLVYFNATYRLVLSPLYHLILPTYPSSTLLVLNYQS